MYLKKKVLCIGLIILFFVISIIPAINANVLNASKLQEDNKDTAKKNVSKWLEQRCKYIKEEVPENQKVKISSTTDILKRFDWRDYNGKNWMTPVKNQGVCGSCTAFAINAVIEAKINIQNKDPNIDRDLSEAHIFFCTNHDCTSGSGFSSLADFIKNDGVCDELSFPYSTAEIGDTLSCTASKNWRCNGVSIKDYKYLDSDRETIKNALINYGPLVASMVTYADFELYMGGIYDKPIGDPGPYHAVCIVGYDEEEQYWICKNSWGKLWGENGYFRIRYGICEIEEDVKLITEVYDINPGSPYIPEKPSGDLLVKPHFYGDYKTKAYDPDNDKIKYLWDWNGDYKVDSETSFINSGEECHSVNFWNFEGKYKIRVRAEDTNGLKSDWSRPLVVTVSKPRERNLFSILDMWNSPLLTRVLVSP